MSEDSGMSEPIVKIIVEASGKRAELVVRGMPVVVREPDTNHPDGPWRVELHGAVISHTDFDLADDNAAKDSVLWVVRAP